MAREARHAARRVLVTGLSSYWGGRLAQSLEARGDIEAVIGVDSREPTRELQRTEFVKVGNEHALIQRIVEAAAIDTVIDTRLVVDSVHSTRSEAHENNVVGTLNILAACAAEGSPVRRLVFKSSAHWYGCEQEDPAFFTEDMKRSRPPRTPLEGDIVEAESYVEEFAAKCPEVTVTVLRCVNVVANEVDTSHTRMLSLPVVPMILGFDPRYQFVHSDDVVRALEHATFGDLPGTYNVAPDGVLVLSEVIGLLDKLPLPILPPWGTGALVGPLRRLGAKVPDEMLNQLRFGRALDNRRYKSTGFSYRYTTADAVRGLAEEQRLGPVMDQLREPYRYEREVEEFLRRSPNVVGAPKAPPMGGEDAATFHPSPPISDET